MARCHRIAGESITGNLEDPPALFLDGLGQREMKSSECFHLVGWLIFSLAGFSSGLLRRSVINDGTHSEYCMAE